jgi:hypothetical protein
LRRRMSAGHAKIRYKPDDKQYGTGAEHPICPQRPTPS